MFTNIRSALYWRGLYVFFVMMQNSLPIGFAIATLLPPYNNIFFAYICFVLCCIKKLAFVLK